MCSDDTTVRIPLRARDGSVRAYTLVDAADADWVNQWRWHINGDGYAKRGQQVAGAPLNIFLHRELLGIERDSKLETDHINRDRLDNRRSKLRAVTHAVNMQNKKPYRGSSSKYRGVSWCKRSRKWAVTVRIDKKLHHFGYFLSEEAAGLAASQARARLMPYSTD